MDARTLRNIQILALDSVENPDYDAFYRRTCRWYSEKFSTPLPDVMALDTVHVLQTYYEERFTTSYVPDDEKQMEVHNRLKVAIIYPDEVAEAEAEDEGWEKKMLEDIQSQNVKATVKAQEIAADQPMPEQPPNNTQDKLERGEVLVMSGEDDQPPTFEE